MGYACYEKDGRDQGYGVPATCDHPGCGKGINRGIAHACGGDPLDYCGLFFCNQHLTYNHETDGPAMCERCHDETAEPFDSTPDVDEWINHKLNDPSWAIWRAENPQWVKNNK